MNHPSDLQVAVALMALAWGGPQYDAPWPRAGARDPWQRRGFGCRKHKPGAWDEKRRLRLVEQRSRKPQNNR